MDQEFPGNSRRASSEPADASSSPLHEPITSRPIAPRKKSLGRRLKDTFIAESMSTVLAVVIADVVVPQVKGLLVDMVNETIDRVFNGSKTRSRTTGNFVSGSRTHVSYNRFGNQIPTRPTQATSTMSNGQPTARRVGDPRDSSDLGDIILDTRVEADSILDTLLLDLEQYKRVTVASLLSLMNQTPTPMDHRWGWKDLSSASIRRVSGGFQLHLPPPEDTR
jgi:hypothetical protein